jgi:hypothetical protein
LNAPVVTDTGAMPVVPIGIVARLEAERDRWIDAHRRRFKVVSLRKWRRP